MNVDVKSQKFWELMTGRASVGAIGVGPQVLLVDGQSLAGGSNGTWEQRNEINRADNGIWMLDGLKRSDGADASLAGPQSLTYDQAVSAVGFKPAYTSGTLPLCFHLAVALRKRRALMGLLSPELITTTHYFSGQPIVEFDDDDPVSGANGPKIHDNRGYWMGQVLDQIGAPVSVPYAIMVQGEANANDALGAYYPAAKKVFGDWVNQAADVIGATPLPAVTQIGGYVKSDITNKTYHVAIEQVQLMIDIGGLVLPPWYAKITGDNNIHPDLQGYAEQADLIAYYLCEHEAGRTIPAFVPKSQTRIGNQIVLDYELRAGERVMFDVSGRYVPYGTHCANQGFQVAGAGITGVSVSDDGGSVVIDCDAPPSSWDYAMQFADLSGSASGGKNYGAHRGLLRKVGRVRPVYGDAQDQHQWAMSWRGSF